MILSYARVSTLGQDKDGATSLAEQTRRNKAIADLRGAPAIDFVKFVDRGVSGTIPLARRPAGREMLAAAGTGDVIVANKMDRLFRSASDALTIAEQLKTRGIELVLIDMGLEPVTSNGTAKLFFGMLACVAEFERERIAERTADGRRAKIEKQGHIGGDAPYGYAVEGRGREAVLVPVEHEQEIVRRARALSERYRPAQVARLLNESGCRSRTSSPFYVYQVERMVSGRGCGNGVG